MVELSDFMAYLDTVTSGLDSHVFKHHKIKDYTKKTSCTRANILYRLIKEKKIFSDTLNTRKLCNLFVDSPPELLAANVEDLLSISTIGKERMFSYIRQYTLVPPTEIQEKRRRQKLKTFTKTKDTSRKLNTKLNQATLLLSSAYKSLLNPGSGCKQTFPLPLALCSPDGDMRRCNKSSFREVMLEMFKGNEIVVTECPFIAATPIPHELIVDFLFILHQPPPPPDIDTFSSYAMYLWEKIVHKLGTCRGANLIRIIVDKSKYLPEPRALLHDTQLLKTGKMNSHECTIGDDESIPQCTEYQKLLANPELKKKFISYLMNSFIKIACNNPSPVQLIIDYEEIECPYVVHNGAVFRLPMLKNQNGEADYNVWYHCMTTTSNKVIVLGSDTDIWVYGMVFMECGWLANRTVYVECKLGSEYVHINKLPETAQLHSKLKQIPLPLTSLAVVYITTGSDYISSFFHTSKKAFTTAFMDNMQYVCSGGFIEMQEVEALGTEGYMVNRINIEGWIKLVCCVYLSKHKTLFNSEPIASLHASLMSSPLSEDKVQLLKWLAYTQITPLQNITQWHDFTRRVCFHHSSGSKDHESLLIPSVSALRFHMSRSEYVLKTVFHACSSNLPPISACEYGWRMVNNQIQIVWDEEEVMDKVKANKGCGCKSAKCDGSTVGCRNCYQMCRPCTMKCKCKLKCNNPHNNGGTCPRCAPAGQSDDSDNSDMENDELLPIVESQRETINTDSETDGDDEHEQ